MLWLYIATAIVVLAGFMVFFGAPYVPSQKKYVRRAFDELYPLKASDVLVDVGSGDGVVLRLAAERGATAIGYEINPVLVVVSRLLSLGNARVQTQLANFWHTDLPKNTTVVYVFGVSRDNRRLVNKMQDEATRLQRSLHLICYASPLAGQKPAKTFEAYRLYVFHPLHLQKAQV